MTMKQKIAYGPDGEKLTPETVWDVLPPMGWSGRWTPARKELVIIAKKAGLITEDDCLRMWGFTADELHDWERRVRRHGSEGLKVTKLQEWSA